jgi:hypothetical protein
MRALPCLYLSMAAGLVALVAASGPARACGGFFCNQPNTPTDLPVAQTGENVLFAMDPLPSGLHRLEAHIQIFYTGPADRFSWVVPTDAMPTLDIGSNAVFAALDPATRPKLMLTRTREGVCNDDRPGVGFGGSASDARGNAAPEEETNGKGPGVQVTFRGSIGPFDAVVVKADDPGRLKAWLAENMYYLSDEGSQLIDAYVQEGKFFVALKLLPGKGVDAIQPIVLRMEGPGPCVPLRLTAVASLPDLRVNLWVLARHRVVPENYFEITLNEAKLDWLNGGGNYQDLIKTAANEAGGNAFTVEYAGPPSVVGPLLPANLDLSRLAFPASRQAAELELSAQGLLGDPEVTQLLDQYFARPVPEMSLAALLEAQVVKPRRAAEALFASHAKLTRLVTFISPDEMKVDPTFFENSTLPDLSNIRRATAVLQCGAREYSSCNAPMRVELADGKKVFYRAPANGGWCGGGASELESLAQMPSLERGWRRATTGEGALQFDNRAAIGAALADRQDEVLGGCSCALGGRGGSAAAVVLAAGLALLIARRRWRR